MFEHYKNYYSWNLITKTDLAIAVALPDDSLTAEEYQTITGEEYVPVTVTSVIKDLQTDLEKVKITASLSGGLSSSRMDGIEADVAVLKGGA